MKHLVPLISAFLLLVVAVAAYSFSYSLVSAKSVEVASLAQQIQQKSTATTDIAAAKSELIALQSEESTVDQYFVSTSDVVPFLEQLTATGKFLGSDVQVVSVSAAPGTPYGELNLSVTITGSFNSVMRTLGAIEYGPQDTTTTNVTLTGPDATTANSTWTANAVFVIGARNVTPASAATVAPVTAAPADTSSVTGATVAAASSSPTPSVSLKAQ